MIKLGFISIHLYSVCLLIGMGIGYLLIVNEAKKHGFKKSDISDMFFYMILFGIVGARVYYYLFNLDYYDSIFDLFKVWEGGLAIHGGIIGGLLSIIFFCKKKDYNLLHILDFVVVGLIIGQAIGRWGNFFNGEAHGMITSLSFLKSMYLPKFIIDGMYINGSYYVPTFLIESIWCFLGFIIMIILRRKKFMHTGYLTSFYLVWYGFERFFVEGMRTDSLMFFSVKVAQIVSIIMILIGICLFIYSYFKCEKYGGE